MEPTQLDRIENLLQHIKTALASKAPGGGVSPVGAVADDSDLDSQYGDEVMKYHLKEKWWPHAEPSYAGKRMSQCPADYLDAVAICNEKQAYAMNASGDAEEAKKATYRTRTAKRARGWAARVRDGVVKPARQIDADPFSDDREGGPIF